MPLSHSRIQVNDTTPTILTVAGQESNTSLTIMIQNLDASHKLYIGGPSLTSTNYGAAIPAGGSLSIDNLWTQDEIYGLSENGNLYAAVLRINR